MTAGTTMRCLSRASGERAREEESRRVHNCFFGGSTVLAAVAASSSSETCIPSATFSLGLSHRHVNHSCFTHLRNPYRCRIPTQKGTNADMGTQHGPIHMTTMAV